MANGDVAPASLPNGHPSSVDHKLTNPLWQTYDIQKLKSTQSVEVSQIIIDEGLVHTSLVLKEVDWFFNKLGIDDEYFYSTPISNIAKHISSLYAGKILAMAAGSDQHDFNLRQEQNDQAFFAVRSIPGSKLSHVYDLERMIDRDYLLEGYSGTDQVANQSRTLPYRLKVFRSAGNISNDLDIQLRFYLLQRPMFSSEIRRPSYVQGVYEPADTDLVKISDKRMIARSSPTTHAIYKSVIDKVVQQLYPVVEIVSSATPGQRRLVVAYHHGSVHSFFSALTDLYHERGLYSTKKFVEQFSNGVTVVAVYLKPLPVSSDHAFNESVVDERVLRVKSDISLIYVLPRHALTPMFSEGRLTVEEVTFAYVGWKFSHQFLSRYRREYGALLSSIEKHEPSLIGHLLRLKQNLRKDTFTEERLLECIRSYPVIIKALYADFAQRHSGGAQPNTPSTPRHTDHDTEALESLIKLHATSEFDTQILLALLSFNRHILRTNFFKQQKIALSFRLSPGFLVPDEYPIVPYGVFFVVGSEFRGFHVRFTDVARGGIRIIKSRNAQAYAHNVGSVFDENYNLALTQMRKNKDIPEGGSKGTIFLSQSHQDKDDVAFRKYVDSMLDILLPNHEIRDYLQQEEILFFGPDEGTANLMDWASQHARARGAHFWKAFTTGKSMSLGGIPHDMFGMTTRSVHQYVVGVLDKLGLKEENVTKLQTGGPDGDLGSNEILISNDKTISVVDGSGVLHDPNGIDRQELQRLAKNRKMVEHFDKSKLSPAGYFINIDSRMVTLPAFSAPIESGLVFRNTFHLLPQAKADLFVPCGGRPEAVNLNNYQEMLDENGKCRFKVIVEGANLFLTQEARLQLENLGTIIYKDASANKGGVTSSSLEVLAALALTDDEFAEHMMVTDSKAPPAFYTAYVKQVQKIIEQNARMEFECIWREHERSGTARCVITDLISNKINALNASLSSSSLWNNKKLRFKVLQDACPPPLTNLLGVEVLASRVPESYIQAIFGAYLAAHFVYQNGLSAPEFAFFDFMENYLHGSSGLTSSAEGC